MVGPNFMDEIDCGNFFDHIDDLLDFPEDNNTNGGLVGGNFDSFPSVWPNPSEVFLGPDPIFSGNHSNSTSELSAELAVPYEDIVQLEWLSNFVEDSFSGGSMSFEKEDSSFNKDSHNQFRTSSPVSVLESSSSCSGGKVMPLSPETPAPGRRGRARSKRPRPATFNPRPAMQLISPTSSFTETRHPFLSPKVSSESENFAESPPLIKIPRPTPTTGEQKKKKKIKLSLPLGPAGTDQTPPSQAVRKCMHCEITKTPQWRAGPMGPKTLCNACGVRHKSGRLFPEYRPAASPTFVPSLHSNSHKKVVEMRSKGCEKTVMAGPATASEATTPLPELIPNSNSLLDYI